jgi:pimeloyl-ACP methyl ester carboxylesterase
MTSGTAELGNVRIAYDTFGSGPPLLLIMGIAAQRVFWDDRLCEQLAQAGFTVIRFDHRDIGQSSKVDSDAVDSPPRAVMKRMLGREIKAAYTLSDMANDCVNLLASLGYASAHVAGISLGGMIAQHMALEHPASVRSVTLIMTTPGTRRYLPSFKALKALVGRRADSEQEAIAIRLATFRVIGSPQFAMNPQRLAQIVSVAYQRDSSASGFIRHFAAMMASGDRSDRLAQMATTPTLIIHGTADPLIPFAAGKRLAQLIPSARFLPVAGMGHDFGEMVWPFLVPSIVRHCQLAELATSA